MAEQEHRRRCENMMTEEERTINHWDIEAYERMEPSLYSSKIGYQYQPGVKMPGLAMQNV